MTPHDKSDNLKKKIKEKEEAFNAAINDLPGAAIDVANNEETDPELINQRTRTLNNNPRNEK